MIGVIDTGGGLRGIYGAGVFDYCLDAGIRFDCCIGISAGSANITSFIAKQRSRNYRFFHNYILRKEYMGIGNFLRHGYFLNLDYVYRTLSNENGEDPLDYDTFAQYDGIYHVIATDAKTGRPMYFDQRYVSRNHYDILSASSCLPMLCKPCVIDGRRYYDGGISDPVPLEHAFSLGCDKVVLILTRPAAYPTTSGKDAIGAWALKQRYPRAARELKHRMETYYACVAEAKKYAAQGRCLIISPDNCYGLGSLTKDLFKLDQMYRDGYKQAKQIRAFLRADIRTSV